MITLFTGSPGAGKTATMVDVLSKLDGSRPLFVDGINGLQIPHTPIDASKWHTDLPDGAVLAIDEVQRHWRARPSGAKVPDAVQALETHRHKGVDVYMTTQSPVQIDVNVRNLVGRHVHIRDTGIMGRWWYEWPETSTAVKWQTCINKRRFKLPKKAFGLYVSSSLHTVPVRGVPRALIYTVLALMILSVLVVGVYRILNRNAVAPAPSISSPAIGPSQHPQSGPMRVDAGAVSAPPIDDRVDFIPRVSNKPESAPAYDHLRTVAVMPRVVGGYCQGGECHCQTQQGTDAGLSTSECREWMRNPPFDPYPPRVLPVAAQSTVAVPPPVSSASPVPSLLPVGPGA